MKVGLTYDLREDYLALGFTAQETVEFDRPGTIDAIAAGLVSLGHTVDRIGRAQVLTRRLLAGDRWELVFNICEGLYGFGREALVPALLDSYRIPYTFSDPLVSATTLHKPTAKRLVREHGLPTPAFAVIETLADLEAVTLALDLALPLFAKPVAEGTSRGVSAASVVRSRAALTQVCADLLASCHQPVLLEAFLPGREFTTGIVGTGQAARVVGTMEVILGPGADAGVYSLRNKENCDELVRYQLLDEPDLSAAVEALALDCWRALGCRDAGRVDIRCDEAGAPSFLEVNPLPGLHPVHSDLPIICGLKGIGFDQLLAWIMESACGRGP